MDLMGLLKSLGGAVAGAGANGGFGNNYSGVAQMAGGGSSGNKPQGQGQQQQQGNAGGQMSPDYWIKMAKKLAGKGFGGMNIPMDTGVATTDSSPGSYFDGE